MSCECNDTFVIREGDTLPILRDQLTDNGTPFDLTGKTLSLVATHTLYGVVLTKTPTIPAPTAAVPDAAVLGYLDTKFAATDLQAGEYTYHYVVVDGLDTISFPNAGEFRMTVTPPR